MSCCNCDVYQQRIRELEELLRLRKIESDVSSEETSDIEPLDLSEHRIEELIDRYYNEELFLQGYRGILSFIYSYVIRDEDNNIVYKCIDEDNKIFQFQDDNGDCISDKKCRVLLDNVCEPLVKKVTKLYKNIINRIYEEEEQDEESEEDEYDSDVEEVIANELCENERSEDENNEKEESKTEESEMNRVVEVFLEIKSCIGKNKNKKQLIDDLSQMLNN